MARKSAAATGLDVVLPITPMLDMTFQLLTFFIFTYHPSAIEGQMEFSLPAPDSGVAAPAPVDAPIISPLPDERSQVTIVLKTQHDGSHDGMVSAVLVQTNLGGETALPSIDALARHLRERRQSGILKPTDSIQIQSESKLKYAFVMKAMDVCAQEGFGRIGFGPPPDLGRAQ